MCCAMAAGPCKQCIRHVALQAWQHRTDGKLYRLHTPQTPIARTGNYGRYAMDEFPSGTNAIVAVLAYTGAPSGLLSSATCAETASREHEALSTRVQAETMLDFVATGQGTTWRTP